MIHSILIEKLKRNTVVQIVLGFLPIILIAIYGVIYTSDLLRVVGVLSYNDRIVSSGIRLDTIKKIESYKENSYDDSFSFTLKDSKDFIGSFNYGSEIYKVYLDEGNKFRYELGSENGILYSDSCPDIVCVDYEGDDLTVVTDDFSYSVSKSDWLLSLVLNTDGSFDLTYNSPNENVHSFFIRDELEVLGDEGTKCLISFSLPASLEVRNARLSLCTSLPDDDIYFDVSRQALVKNVGKDFCKNYILGSNILVVFFVMLLYVVLTRYVGFSYGIPILRRTEVLFTGVFGLAVLLISFLFAIILI